MKDTEQWLTEKMREYNENPEEMLLDYVVTMRNVVQQYLEYPWSNAQFGVMEVMAEHTKLLLEEIEKQKAK